MVKLPPAEDFVQNIPDLMFLAVPALNAVVQPTLRDQFAMAALTGLLSLSSWHSDQGRQSVARFSYAIADEMLKVCDGQQPPSH